MTQLDIAGRPAGHQITVDRTLPVGSVLAYAGTLPGDLRDEGWLLCDGGRVLASEYGELFQAIDYNFGAVSHTVQEFRLPDLRGLFIRGTCADEAVRKVRDPEWDARSALMPGGRDGRYVGSYQDYGTAKPVNPFSVRVSLLDIKDSKDDKCKSDPPGEYTDRTIDRPVYGGDLETRPVNKYVHFIIKASSRTPGGAPVRVPVGAVIAYAAPFVADAAMLDNWDRCEGQSRFVVGRYAELYRAIGFAHGRFDDDHFLLPDYRGWFLRGVSGDTARDPERTGRPAAWPGGRKGNDVGSQQEWATGVPHDPILYTSFSRLPYKEESRRVSGTINYMVRYNPGNAIISITSGGGGDAETRPANVSVDFYICSDRLTAPRAAAAQRGAAARPGAGADTELVPVGGVVAAGTNLPENHYWLPCDGRTCVVADQQELFDVLGYTYGKADDGGFLLPDYRSRFLRGADHATGRDPDAARRQPAGSAPATDVGSVQEYATGKPRKDFTVTVPNLPNSEVGTSGVTHSGNAGNGGPKTFDPWSKGGNRDTRPANVYLNFYIRAR